MLYYDHIIAKNIINFLTLLSKSYEKTTFHTILKPYKSPQNHHETIAGNHIETILTRNSTFDEFIKGAVDLTFRQYCQKVKMKFLSNYSCKIGDDNVVTSDFASAYTPFVRKAAS